MGFNNFALDGRIETFQASWETPIFPLFGCAIFVAVSKNIPTAWGFKFNDPPNLGAENSSNWRLSDIWYFFKLNNKINILFLVKDNKIYINRKQILLAFKTYKNHYNALNISNRKKHFSTLTR